MFRLNDSAGNAGSPSSDPSPVPPALRRGGGRVRGPDFGLPERAGLLGLARTYLEAQARHWPELVGTQAVPAVSAATIEAMADDFIRRFRGDLTEVFEPAGTPRAWASLGVAYVRFSDENSNPRSLDQQLGNVLRRAQQEQIFIPWPYVLADAAVSGTLACRGGYAIAKTLLERRDDSGVAWFLFDDLSRMSRDTIESLKLGELARETGVRVVGASDGFDSANPQSSFLLPVLGSMNEAFITQLKSKVHRGMDDAFHRGDNIHPPGAGYRLVDVRDSNGNLLITHKNTIEKRVEVDPEAADWIRRGAEMLAHEGKSPGDVARLFNQERVAGMNSWSDGRIRDLYRRERLVGVDVFRKTRHVVNKQTGKRRVETLPEKNWLRREVPHLRILSDALASTVKQKLGQGAAAFGRKARRGDDRPHRVDLYPKLLIRPICGCCQTPMSLGRAAGKYRSLVCLNSIHGSKGCTNRGYKSERIINEAVLGRVMAVLFTDDFLDRLTEEVNGELSRAIRRPAASTKPLELEIANRERQVAGSLPGSTGWTTTAGSTRSSTGSGRWSGS
ncbi:MAG: recombinase family protein [Planctomycetes bacterium]|nr:recombinase family protein [Planctomycetota bacterium]